jgi:hypothetical protein
MDSWNIFFVHKHTRTHKIQHGLNLGEVTTFSPYSILCGLPWGLHTNDIFIRIPHNFWNWDLYNFLCKPPIKVRTKAKLYPLLRAFQRHVARLLHTCNSRQFLIFSGWESKLTLWLSIFLLTIICVIGIQMDNASPF